MPAPPTKPFPKPLVPWGHRGDVGRSGCTSRDPTASLSRRSCCWTTAPSPSWTQSGSPGSQGSQLQALHLATAAGSGDCARPSARAAARAKKPVEPQGPARGARGIGSGTLPTSAGGGREGRSALASSPHAGLGWRRAGLGAAGARRTREVTGEVARCLAVCLQRAPPLSTRLYNLTHNWP